MRFNTYGCDRGDKRRLHKLEPKVLKFCNGKHVRETGDDLKLQSEEKKRENCTL